LKIPFVFVTGYGAGGVIRGFPAAFANKPRLAKPCSTEALKAVLLKRRSGPAEG
jgi:hypothetical protein